MYDSIIPYHTKAHLSGTRDRLSYIPEVSCVQQTRCDHVLLYLLSSLCTYSCYHMYVFQCIYCCMWYVPFFGGTKEKKSGKAALAAVCALFVLVVAFRFRQQLTLDFSLARQTHNNTRSQQQWHSQSTIHTRARARHTCIYIIYIKMVPSEEMQHPRGP